MDLGPVHPKLFRDSPKTLSLIREFYHFTFNVMPFNGQSWLSTGKFSMSSPSHDICIHPLISVIISDTVGTGDEVPDVNEISIQQTHYVIMTPLLCQNDVILTL